MNPKWEDLKVYKPLKKEDLKTSFNEFQNIIAVAMSKYDFKQHGRKLIRKTNDVFQVIHIDTRGSWTGLSESFKIEIAIVAISDVHPFIYNHELENKKIEQLAPKMRNHTRLNTEYPLLADYIIRNLIENIIPYFSLYNSSKTILKAKNIFFEDKFNKRPYLILYSELQNGMSTEAKKILEKEIEFIKNLAPNENGPAKLKGEDLESMYKFLTNNDVESINLILEKNIKQNLKKLKL